MHCISHLTDGNIICLSVFCDVTDHYAYNNDSIYFPATLLHTTFDVFVVT